MRKCFVLSRVLLLAVVVSVNAKADTLTENFSGGISQQWSLIDQGAAGAPWAITAPAGANGGLDISKVPTVIQRQQQALLELALRRISRSLEISQHPRLST